MSVQQDNLTALLGTSLKFPLEVDASGKVELVSGQENIEQAIKDRILTLKNTRFFLPQYGSDVAKLRGLPQTVTISTAKFYIKECLAEEKRIIIRDILVSVKEGITSVTIEYQLRNSTIKESTTVTL